MKKKGVEPYVIVPRVGRIVKRNATIDPRPSRERQRGQARRAAISRSMA